MVHEGPKSIGNIQGILLIGRDYCLDFIQNRILAFSVLSKRRLEVKQMVSSYMPVYLTEKKGNKRKKKQIQK